MSPERAKVFVAEDDKRWQAIIQDILEGAGHRVVLTAMTRADALAAVEQLTELGVDVAAIDGNLNDCEHSGRDGQAILAAIRTQAPRVRTVGISANLVPGADANARKEDMNKLGEIVSKL